MVGETAVVRFLRGYSCYNVGEKASFPIKAVEAMIKKGIAVLADPDLKAEDVGIVTEGDEQVSVDNSTHELTLDGVAELVDHIDDLETLQKVWNGELAHPNHEGGRHGALKLLRARAKLLKEAAGGEEDG